MISPTISTPGSFNRRNIFAAIACLLLLISFALISWFAWLHKCATFDEPLHLVGGWVQTHYDDFRCNPEDPPLWKYYVAAGTRTENLKLDLTSNLWAMMVNEIPAPAVHFVLKSMYQTPGNDADALLRAARARMLFLGMILGVAIAWWAWKLSGPVAAMVACAAFCLDPNFLAHAALVKNDVPITLIFFLLMAFVWKLGECATLPRIFAVAVLIGVALTTKFSGILAIPMLAIALLCRSLIASPWKFLRWTLVSRVHRLTASGAILCFSLFVTYVIVWGAYGFRFGPSTDAGSTFNFRSAILQCAENEMLVRQNPIPAYPPDEEIRQWVNDWKPSLTVRAVRFADKEHLLPQAWLYGFLYTYGTSLARRTFFCGEIGVAGWWYYFPAAMLFKTPLATLIGLALASLICVSSWRRKKITASSWTILAALVGPAFYMFMAMKNHLNIGLRHVLPVYPFIFLFLGVIAARSFNRRPKLTCAALLILLFGLAGETLAAFPNYIPFFNAAVGGSRGGLALLSDSSIDWGQDLPALAHWQQQNPGRQLYYCEFGLPDPHYYGLHYINMEGSQVGEPDETTPNGLPPVYAISAVVLQGPYLHLDKLAYYRKFLQQQPIAVLNGCIYLYDSAPPQ